MIFDVGGAEPVVSMGGVPPNDSGASVLIQAKYESRASISVNRIETTGLITVRSPAPIVREGSARVPLHGDAESESQKKG